MGNEYSNEVLHEVLVRVEAKVTKIDDKVAVQNGRVTKLENKDSFNKGGLAILTVLVLPIGFIVLSNLLK